MSQTQQTIYTADAPTHNVSTASSSPNLNPPYATTTLETTPLIQTKNTFITIIYTIINAIRFTVGLALLAGGSIFLYHILLEIYNAYQNIQANTFVSTLIDGLTNQPVYIDSNADITLLMGSSGAIIIAVLLSSLVALIALRAAFMFFTAGIKVLSIRF